MFVIILFTRFVLKEIHIIDKLHVKRCVIPANNKQMMLIRIQFNMKDFLRERAL